MASKAKPKCKYWDSCFREDPRHIAKYLHPDDEKQDDKKDSGAKKRKLSIDSEEENKPTLKRTRTSETKPQLLKKTSTETKPQLKRQRTSERISQMKKQTTVENKTELKKQTTTERKPALKRRRTHAISESEDEGETEPPKAKKKMVTVATNTEAEDDEPAAAAAAASPSPGKGKRRQKCQYWNKCYRKDPTHKKTFIHPGDKDEHVLDYGQDEGTRFTRGKKKSLIKPLHEMEDGNTADVTGKGVTYKLKRTGDHYFCTCLGWKNQNKATDKRTCKHLREYLGDEFEDCRCGIAKPETSDNVATINRRPRHKQIKQLLLAHKWQEDTQDPTGWWMSEKLDGVRAFWDGTTFFSRLGNEFIPPPWFIKDFPPDMELDGELFGGRSKFQSTVSIVKTPGSDKWKDITYEIFDVPSLEKQPFEKRIQASRDYFDEHPVKHVNVLEQVRCKGADHIEAEITKVEAMGGEGLMIREPKSKYVHGRSHTLLKIKKFHDAEAKVIGYVPGKGNNTGKTGALRCVMECGKEFSVGSGLNDKLRARPPKIGSIITYKFQELTNSGVPRFPSYIGIRIDMDGPKDAILPEGKTKKEDS